MKDKVVNEYFRLIKEQFQNMDVSCKIVDDPPFDWSVQISVRALVYSTKQASPREYVYSARTTSLDSRDESQIQDELNALCHFIKRHMCEEIFTPKGALSIHLEGI